MSPNTLFKQAMSDVADLETSLDSVASAKDHLEIHERLEITGDPEIIWNSFKIFGAIDHWHPATLNCRLILGEEGVPGAVREFDIKGGGHVISELLRYDEERRYFRYRILKTNLPLHGYVGEMWVTSDAPQTCTLHWRGAFMRPPGAGKDRDQPTKDLVKEVFVQGLSGIQAKLF